MKGSSTLRDIAFLESADSILSISFCFRSFFAPFYMMKTIIIAQLLTCEYERLNKNDQLRFVSLIVSQKLLFGENFGIMQCFPNLRRP